MSTHGNASKTEQFKKSSHEAQSFIWESTKRQAQKDSKLNRPNLEFLTREFLKSIGARKIQQRVSLLHHTESDGGTGRPSTSTARGTRAMYRSRCCRGRIVVRIVELRQRAAREQVATHVRLPESLRNVEQRGRDLRFGR
jgi:hypothetical protein